MAATVMCHPAARNPPHPKKQQQPLTLAPQWRVKLPPARPTVDHQLPNLQKPLASVALEEEFDEGGDFFTSDTYKIRVPGFQILGLIGEGAFGRVFRATRLLRGQAGGVEVTNKVALKVFKAAGDTDMVGKKETESQKEIAMSMMLSKEAEKERAPIVKTLGLQLARVASTLGKQQQLTLEFQDCMAMELCEGGCLLGYMKRPEGMTEREVAMFLEPIARALQFCHGKGVTRKKCHGPR